MANELKRFKATHRTNDKVGYFQFYSLKQAKYFNPYFKEWKEI